MLVKIKNRAPHAVLLKSNSGDVIQINASAIKEVSDEFLASYNSKEIQLLSRKPLQTEVAQKEEFAVNITSINEGKSSNKTSRKSS